jgi:hypothetical protein
LLTLKIPHLSARKYIVETKQPEYARVALIMRNCRRRILSIVAFLLVLAAVSLCVEVQASVNPPEEPVRLIFIHHSCGSNWLSDSNGGLGIALRDNNYFVSDTNYGWGPDEIGSSTDIGHWWLWFRGPDSAEYLDALYAESGQHSSYSRMSTEVSGENEVIMFKSCYPNSALKGDVNDPVPEIDSNPLRGKAVVHGITLWRTLREFTLTYLSTSKLSQISCL